jgi:hypothetical protein
MLLLGLEWRHGMMADRGGADALVPDHDVHARGMAASVPGRVLAATLRHSGGSVVDSKIESAILAGRFFIRSKRAANQPRPTS